MQTKSIITGLVATILFFYCANQLNAGTTGKLSGIVVEEKTGLPLPGANVLIEGTTMGAATDLDGNFAILRVPPGIYILRTTMMGYSDVRYENIQVSIDKTTKVDFQLKEAILEVGETITIVAEKSLVQLDLTSSEASIGAHEIESLPVQSFDDIVNLQAGVVDGHFRGGRSGEVVYMIDGISVNDVYTGDFALEVETNSIQELQVISGTFNAEYGQAMSGIVNIVTKEGGQSYHGSVTSYTGDYISSNDDVFWDLDNYNPTYNLQGNLSGPLPIFGDKITFFGSARYFEDEGYVYGREVFLPADHSNFSALDPENWFVQSHGFYYDFSEELADSLIENSESVPMQSEKQITGQGKLTYKLTENNKLSYEFLFQKKEFMDYDGAAHDFRLNPNGAYQKEQDSFNNSLIYTRIVGKNTFFTLKLSQLSTEFKQFTFEDIFDPNYISTDRLRDAGANAFLTGGSQNWQFTRNTKTRLGKIDFTSQMTKSHLIKAGVEAKLHELELEEFEVIPELESRINPITAFNNNDYIHKPAEYSVYLQDKMEFADMIINAGLRYDSFDPDGVVPLDFKNPNSSPVKEAKSSRQLSPRIGIGYPMSDRGQIHVSYGHFFQTPNFRYMYLNPEFDVFPLQTTPSKPIDSELNTMGNASLEPQKTVIYEMGLQQQLSENIGLTLTAYYKDMENLLGTEVLETINGDRYGRFINRDYGNVRGFTIAFDKRPSNNFSASIDYTFQIAEGNASDPNSAFLDQQTDPPLETEKQLVPLDWDRRHQLNINVTYGKPSDYTISLINKLGSGFPYTPTQQNVRTAVENSERRPTIYTVDLYSYKNLEISGLNFQLFVRVFNLLDRQNEKEVFTDTGRAGYTLQGSQTEGFRIRGVNTEDDFFARPDHYSAPRQIQAGITVEF